MVHPAGAVNVNVPATSTVATIRSPEATPLGLLTVYVDVEPPVAFHAVARPTKEIAGMAPGANWLATTEPPVWSSTKPNADTLQALVSVLVTVGDVICVGDVLLLPAMPSAMN